MGKRRRASDDGKEHDKANDRAGMKPYRRYVDRPHTPDLQSSSIDRDDDTRGEWTTPTRAKLRCLDQYA
ncbi:MAG: hypothetical protein M1835_004366, partial [Candelina submexicana]